MIKGALAAAFVLGMGASALPAVPVVAEEPTAEFNIVNGTPRSDTDYPETVVVATPVGQARQSGNILAEWCGGTILDDEWILTAAHCIEDWDTTQKIQVGAYTPFGKASDGKTYQIGYLASRAYMHPQYKKVKGSGRPVAVAEHDVALIKLDKPISSGKPVHPQTKQPLLPYPGEVAKLPKVNLADKDEALPTGVNGTVVGRGASWWESFGNGGQYRANRDLLESAEVPVLGPCASSKMICAGRDLELTDEIRQLPENQRHDRRQHRHPASCQGDSGGPLFVDTPNGRKQVGIVSNSPVKGDQSLFWNGDICGRTKTYYASITYLRPWIEHVMFSNIPDGQEPTSIYLPTPSASGRTNGLGSPITRPGEQPQRPADPPAQQQPDNQQQPPAEQPPAAPQLPPPAAPQQPPRQQPGGQAPAPAPLAPPAPAPAPAPAPEKPGPKPEPKPPRSLARTGDPEFFKSLPTPSQGAMQWVLPSFSADQGSELAIGVNRLRNAFKDDAIAPSNNQKRIALLASEIKMADALASGVLQRDASLYLTSPDALESFTMKELKETKVEEVWLLGGPAALSPAIEEALKAEGMSVRRIAGADRTQTAVEIAKAHAERNANASSARFVARAFGDKGDETRSWADSIALGGLAAKTNTPILLTATQQLSDSLKAQLGSGMKTTVVGGNAAVSPQVKEAINAITGSMPNRIAGANRADTAGRIAQSFDKAERAIVIDGQGPNAWQLGFSLAGLSHDLNAPILLTAGTTVPPETKKILKDLELQNVICMGEVQVCEAVTEATNQ